MYEAVEKTQANASILFVPASYAADAIMEAADAGIKLIICCLLYTSANNKSDKFWLSEG